MGLWAVLLVEIIIALTLGGFAAVMWGVYFPWQDRRQARWEAEEKAEEAAQVGAASPAVQ